MTTTGKVMTARIPWLVALGLAFIVQAGCSRFKVSVPSGFVTLKRARSRQVLVSADNTVIVVREWKNRPKGDGSFWTATLRRDFEKVRGYKFVGSKPAKSNRGMKGTTLHFQGAYRGGMYDYFVTLFVLPDWIYTVEMLAQHRKTDKYSPAFQKVVATLEPR